MRLELSSPGTGASVSVALNGAPAPVTSSRPTLLGVGYRTWIVSMLASQPQALNWASACSAFFLLCGAPTWIGSADISFSQRPISASLMAASNFASSAASAAAAATGASATSAVAVKRAARRERDFMETPPTGPAGR